MKLSRITLHAQMSHVIHLLPIQKEKIEKKRNNLLSHLWIIK